MPSLVDLRGGLKQKHFSRDFLTKASKILRRLQLHVNDEDNSWAFSRSDINKRISLPHLNEVIINLSYGALHADFFMAFSSLDSLREITISIPRKLCSFERMFVAFIGILKGSFAPQIRQPLIIRIGEASLKPQTSEWSVLDRKYMRDVLYQMVHELRSYGAEVLFALPDATYGPLERFNTECPLPVTSRDH
jgi:hypothetical protein